MKNRNTLACFAVSLLGLMICAGPSQAAETKISGIISTTLTLTEDSELVGDVMCTVVGAPCIAFGAGDIKLRLNGFTMMGRAEPPSTCPSLSGPESGILVNGQHDVAILGPGLVQKFALFGIALTKSTKVRVEGVTASENCFSGIFLSGTTDSDIEKNVSVRNSMGSRGNPCGGT
jgi:parallel beta-helix repeat protein